MGRVLNNSLSSALLKKEALGGSLSSRAGSVAGLKPDPNRQSSAAASTTNRKANPCRFLEILEMRRNNSETIAIEIDAKQMGLAKSAFSLPGTASIHNNGESTATIRMPGITQKTRFTVRGSLTSRSSPKASATPIQWSAVRVFYQFSTDAL